MSWLTVYVRELGTHLWNTMTLSQSQVGEVVSCC